MLRVMSSFITRSQDGPTISRSTRLLGPYTIFMRSPLFATMESSA